MTNSRKYEYCSMGFFCCCGFYKLCGRLGYRKLFIVIIIIIAVMATTIQVSDTTKQMLDMLKEKKHAKTHDMLIHELLEKEAKIPKSMFGSIKGLKWNKEEDRAIFREL